MSHWNLAMWAVVAMLLFWGIGAYNRLMRLRNAISAAFVQLDEHLTARAQLCTKLLTLLQPLLSNEKATFDALELAQAEVRTAAQAARQPVGDTNPFIGLERQVSTGIAQALEHYRKLRDSSQETAFRIAYR